MVSWSALRLFSVPIERCNLIHPSAIVDPSAKIADGVEIGPFSIIGADVEIGEGCVIGPHAVVRGPTVMGRDNRVFQFASIGEDCQDKKYAGEPTRLEIGDGNVFREGCTVHRGTVQDQGLTSIGSHNLFMAYTHVAHDCVIGNHVIMANNAAAAGHVVIGDYAILGGFTAVHQFCQIGERVMCAAGTVVFKDIPAYVMCSGNPAKPHGINAEGLRRAGFEADAVKAVKDGYKTVYRRKLTIEQALVELSSNAEQAASLTPLITSLQNSSRGIIR